MATGQSDDVKLIGAWVSPFVMRPRVALNIKSIGYEFLQEQFGSKSELLLKSNPVHKKIPVLLHNGKPICESLVIVQYIDEAWSSSGPSILPSDPYDRALSRFWAAYIDEKFFPSWAEIRRAEGEEAKKTAIEQVKEGLKLLDKAFEECSKGKAFFNGDQVGYLDIALGCYLGWLRVTERMNGLSLVDETNTPHLSKWAERFCNDPAVKPIMPEIGELLEYAKVILAKTQAASSK